MANPTVSQARSFQENPRHYPRKLQVGVYNFFSKRIPYKPLPANPKKILVQAQEKIGDAVLLFPTISGLRKLFPESVIHLLCSRINEPLFQSIKEVEKTMVYRSGRQFWNALKETKYDLFYNPKDHPSITAFKISKNVRADVKVCIAHPRMEQHYHHGLTLNNTYRILEKNAMILRAYDLDFMIRSFFPNIELNSPKNKNQISINLSSGSGLRKWPLENWIKLSNLIGNDYEIIIVGGPSEENDAKYIKSQTKNSHNFCNKFSVSELYFVFKHSHIAISNDTGAMHLCDATGTPVIGLFSTKELSPKWYPNNDKSIVIEDEISISNIDSYRVYEAINLKNS